MTTFLDPVPYKNGPYLLIVDTLESQDHPPTLVRIRDEGMNGQFIIGPAINQKVNYIPQGWRLIPLVAMTRERIAAIELALEVIPPYHSTVRIILLSILKDVTP